MKIEIKGKDLFRIGILLVVVRIVFVGVVFLYSGWIGNTAIESVGGSAYGREGASVRRQCRDNPFFQILDYKKWTPRSLASNKSMYDLCIKRKSEYNRLTAEKLKNTNVK